ncbi:MAG: AAC(3) family N-acetyltransferase [Lentisphaeria bacterium]|nr:AAC(3) family N-acetyltransferase [Lentisphaeria bacterium]
MKELYRYFRSRIDGDDLVKRTKELCRIEQGQTFRHYRMAAEHILSELKKYNIPNAEIVSVPADGVTSYEDKRMPIAWDATIGKLTLCDKDETVAADYNVHPFHLIKGSVATAPGGEVMRIITEQQFLAGEDPKGALVMLESNTWPRKPVVKPILDLGGRGIISDFLTVRYDDVDAIQWVNACSDSGDWHVTAEDRDFIGFSVSLRYGDKIRQMANKGVLKAKVECDGRRYVGELPAVTALIPGKRQEEVWILAHAYEPLLNDDSNGITAGIEIARRILERGETPEYSLRLVFAMELYGFAAFHANFKGKVIGGANIDSLPVMPGDFCRLTPPVTTIPFHGIDVLKEIAAGFEGSPETELMPPQGFDDMFLSDSTTGVPTMWFMWGGEKHYCHSTIHLREDFMDQDVFAKYVSLVALWAYKTVFFTGEAAPLPELKLVKQDTPWRAHAAKQVFKRTLVGLPHSQVRVPADKRRSLPDGVIYGPFESVLSRLDGKKDLEQVIMEAEAERKTTITDGNIKKYLSALNYLADYGYIEAVKRTALTSDMLAAALKELGIKENDVLLVHASVSKCGYFENGAEGIINGICNAVGEGGTALFTSFTRPYIYLGGLNRGWNYRPHDPKDLSQIWTGEISKVLLEKFPGAVRSKHATHSWAGIGAKAEYCVSAHGETEPPASASSPMGKAMELGGKILFIGSGIAPTTFLHYLETEANSKFLERAVCKIRRADGSDEIVTIDQHLPGHRDFYRADAENCKFYQRAVARGLRIAEVPFGMAKLHLIDINELHDIGMELFREDPDVLLCDDPDCMFCSKYRH